MKENKTQLNKYTMHYGALFGIYWTAVQAFSIAGIHAPSLMAAGNAISNLLLAGTIFLAGRFTIQYRKKALNNQIGAFHAWQFGLKLYFYAALVNAVPQYIYLEYFAPENFITMIFQQKFQLMKSMGANPELLKNAMEQVPDSAISMIIQNIFNCLFIGTLLSIPVAFFVRRISKENTTPTVNSSKAL
jgi:hypothetical protein